MEDDEGSLLLDCPKCSIKITVKISTCREGSSMACPICSKDISYCFTKPELDDLIERSRRQQDRELRKSFPLSFGDL